jgi:hypothetical protein
MVGAATDTANYDAVGTPAACSILVIDPLEGSKKLVFTVFQPPR